MKVCVIAQRCMDHQRAFAAKICAGIAASGDVATLAAPGEFGIEGYDLFVAWGWRLAEPLRAMERNVLIAERGYIGDRFAWTSLGWNGLNGRAIFPPGNGDERLRTLFPEALKPWNPQGEYALLIGQVPGDAALYGKDLASWYLKMANEFRKQGLAVKYRPHPLAIELGQDYPVDGAVRLDGSLDETLAGARVVVTWNSNTGVDAVLAGKPTIAADRGSMAWSVAAHGWTILDAEPSRDAWAAHLAWKQWSDEELRNGVAWTHVSKTL